MFVSVIVRFLSPGCFFARLRAGLQPRNFGKPSVSRKPGASGCSHRENGYYRPGHGDA
jgi:hypothetical protein